MLEDEEHGQIELLVDSRRAQDDADEKRQAQLDAGRRKVEGARLALAEMAQGAVWILGARLQGLTVDSQGVKITDERVDAALTILDRVGVPKLRATAIAASIAAAPTNAAPGSPGWAPVEKGDDGADELDKGTVDAAIDEFLAGYAFAEQMRRDEPE